MCATIGASATSMNRASHFAHLFRNAHLVAAVLGVALALGCIVAASLTMMPQTAIKGRIIDGDGKPVAGLRVQLLRRQLDDGEYIFALVGQAQKDTDEDGRFRIGGLEPGTYVLRTPNTEAPEQQNLYLDHGYPAMYYPGAHERGEAKTIVLHAGDEFTADMTVAKQKLTQVTVGIAWDKPWAMGQVEWGVSGDSREDNLNCNWDDARRVFTLYAPAGDYTLGFTIFPPTNPNASGQPAWPDGSTQLFIGSAVFTVKDQPLNLTGVPSQQPVTIPVHVRAELAEQEKWKAAATIPRPYKAPAVSFGLAGAKDGLNHEVYWRSEQSTSDVAFKDIQPGSYVVRGSTLCCNAAAYIASLNCGGTDLLREPLVVEAGVPACTIEAVIRDDVAQIAVGLTPKALGELREAGISVTDMALIPVDEQRELPYSAAVWVGSDPKMNMVRPGKYLAFLFDGRQIAWRDPDERQRLMRLGTLVTLAPDESRTVQLDWLPELNDPHKQPVGVALGQVLP